MTRDEKIAAALKVAKEATVTQELSLNNLPAALSVYRASMKKIIEILDAPDTQEGR